MNEFLDPNLSGIEQKEEEDAEVIPENESVLPPQFEREEPAEIGIIRELSPKKVLEQVRMNLKGYDWDYANREWKKDPDRKPLMNDKGMSKYLSILSSVVTDLVTFSSYKPQEINSLVLYVCDKAIPTIHINYKEYGIQEKSDLEIIDIQIFNLTKAAFHKALGAGDRNVIRGTVNESLARRETNQPYNMPRKKGFLSSVNPFSTRGEM